MAETISTGTDGARVVESGKGLLYNRFTLFPPRNMHCMQLPFTPALPPEAPADPEVLEQRRQEQAKRLVEMNQRKRERKVRFFV